MLDRLERKLGRYAIPRLTTYLVGGQVAVFVLTMVKPELASRLLLIPSLVLEGEVWRPFTFVFTEEATGTAAGITGTWSILWFLVRMSVLYFMGNTLESLWGSFRYNVYVLLGWALTVGASFLLPYAIFHNSYLIISVGFAFAYLFPDFEFALWFILPVKAKWFSWLIAAGLAFAAWDGAWPERILIVASVSNFFLFFAHDFSLRLRGKGRQRVHRRAAAKAEREAHHECTVCGVTDLDDPQMQFRYCSKCEGKHGYCMAHLADHEHVVSADG